MNNVENFILLLGYDKTYNKKVQTVEAFIDHDIYYFETRKIAQEEKMMKHFMQ